MKEGCNFVKSSKKNSCMYLDPGSESPRMEDQTMNINIEELKKNNFPLMGACSGIYFLFNKDDLVYVGQGWNCFLRVAEHTRKEKINRIEFTHWSYIPIEDETQRRSLERQLIRKYRPIENRI